MVSEDTRTRLFDGVRRLAEGIALAHGAEAEVRLRTGYPVLVNDVEVTDIVAEVARHLLGPDRVKILPAPVMPSEDFSYILQRVPGAMVFLGARPDREAPAAPVHSSLMILDEAAMIAGSALHAAVALRFLDPDRARR